MSVAAIYSGGTLDVNLTNSREELWKFAQATSAGTLNIWAPPSGSCVHITTLIVSCSGANSVALNFSNSTLCYLDFNEKNAVPISMPFELCGGINEVLRASISSAGTVSITAVGHESGD